MGCPGEFELELNQTVTQAELEDVFSTNFGYQIKGINLRRAGDQRYIILLSNEGEIYDDRIGNGDRFRYIGEGVPEKGDQPETAANRALKEATRDLIPIYFFTSVEGVDAYEYEGLVDVMNHTYVNDGERMVYRFEMQTLGSAGWDEYTDARATIMTAADEDPSLTETTAREQTTRLARSSAFAKQVKRAYGDTCAACGAARRSPDGNPEVEAAHIFPKADGGIDRVHNGLALCRLHHWAFDTGWFTVTDDFEIILNDRTDETVPKEIRALEGAQLTVPEKPTKQPSPDALQAHRELHGME
ncbi:restriction endonuclease-like protein [Natrialba chahannaoensis JCM 10990]|uniref:Restriction endonuclease-like protein n=1 Tax=Natrialba chahannaoensis JCM 10990 TaxID=1227492 RepID=M0AE46_9EURY|nr:HNH endonuclease [Natrialba chahannaoensis]ELY96995.1 restriction endonuclease-like protein [Natrialba chahannaoensis JCM 10990]